MTAHPGLLPPGVMWSLALLQLIALLLSLRLTPWRQLRAAPSRTHLVLGTLVALVMLWMISARPHPLLSLHLIGVTSATLLLGAPLAILAGSIAQFILIFVGLSEPAAVLPNALIGVTLPAMITVGVLRLIMRSEVRNPFMFLIGAGFFGGAASMLATWIAGILLVMVAGRADSFSQWSPEILVLVMFPEGFINGAIVTAIAVYAPHWMKLLDERHFFGD